MSIHSQTYEKKFKTKTVLITGAGSGIGKATAILFAQQGANLVLVGRNESHLQGVSKEVQSLDVNCQVFSLDLSKESNVDILFSKISHLDVAINNAGIEGKVGKIVDLTSQDFDEVMNINVRSLWLCMQKQIQFFIHQKIKGNIINVSSVGGLQAIPESCLYTGSKHAVLGITKSVAVEQIRNGIRINAVCPGAVETPMLQRVIPVGREKYERSLPIGRIADPKEIAEAILWLASEQSSYVVGSSLVIDGGILS